MARRNSARSNPIKLYWISFALGHLVLLPFLVPLFLERGARPSDLLLLQALYSVCVIAIELPSGILADRWGRKRTLVIGASLWFAGHLVLLLLSGLAGLVAYRALIGLAAGMISGADIALLYDSQRYESASTRKSSLGNLQAARSISETFAALVASLLMIWSLNAVLWAQVALSLLPLLIASTLVEPRMDGAADAETPALSGQAYRRSFDPKLRIFAISLVALGTATSLGVWLNQIFWNDIQIDARFFGYLWAAYNLVVAVSSRYSTKIEGKLGLRAVLILGLFLPGIGFLGMSLSAAGAGLLFAGLLQASRGFQMSQLREAYNAPVPASIRATANSILSLAMRLVFAIIAIAAGGMLAVTDTRTSLGLLGAGFLFLAAILYRPLGNAFRIRACHSFE